MMKTKRVLSMICVLLFVMTTLIPLGVLSASASAPKIESYVNPETGFRAVIRDEINLLSESEKAQLLERMIPITEYGHIGFSSTNIATDDTLEQARQIRKKIFGMDSGSVFVVNMKERQLSIQSYGTIYQYVSTSRARSITDNVHRYASNGDYYTAAAEAYQQMTDVLNGKTIAEPMRYYSNAMIALMIGMIIAIGIVFLTRFNPNVKKSDEELNSAEIVDLVVTNNRLAFCKTLRTVNSSSSGCSGSGCGGCGGGGCGGGGGSSF